MYCLWRFRVASHLRYGLLVHFQYSMTKAFQSAQPRPHSLSLGRYSTKLSFQWGTTQTVHGALQKVKVFPCNCIGDICKQILMKILIWYFTSLSTLSRIETMVGDERLCIIKRRTVMRRIPPPAGLKPWTHDAKSKAQSAWPPGPSK